MPPIRSGDRAFMNPYKHPSVKSITSSKPYPTSKPDKRPKTVSSRYVEGESSDEPGLTENEDGDIDESDEQGEIVEPVRSKKVQVKAKERSPSKKRKMEERDEEEEDGEDIGVLLGDQRVRSGKGGRKSQSPDKTAARHQAGPTPLKNKTNTVPTTPHKSRNLDLSFSNAAQSTPKQPTVLQTPGTSSKKQRAPARVIPVDVPEARGRGGKKKPPLGQSGLRNVLTRADLDEEGEEETEEDGGESDQPAEKDSASEDEEDGDQEGLVTRKSPTNIRFSKSPTKANNTTTKAKKQDDNTHGSVKSKQIKPVPVEARNINRRRVSTAGRADAEDTTDEDDEDAMDIDTDAEIPVMKAMKHKLKNVTDSDGEDTLINSKRGYTEDDDETEHEEYISSDEDDNDRYTQSILSKHALVKVLRKHKILLNKAETEQIAQLQQELTPVNKTIQTAYIKLGGKLKDKLVTQLTMIRDAVEEEAQAHRQSRQECLDASKEIDEKILAAQQKLKDALKAKHDALTADRAIINKLYAKQKKESGTGEKALEELYQKHSSEVTKAVKARDADMKRLNDL